MSLTLDKEGGLGEFLLKEKEQNLALKSFIADSQFWLNQRQ
jgi:hypothetical protein